MATTGKGIADAIRQRMEDADITVNALHVATGIPYNTLKGRLNTGHNLEVEELRLIAEALGTEPHRLWAEAIQAKKIAA